MAHISAAAPEMAWRVPRIRPALLRASRVCCNLDIKLPDPQLRKSSAVPRTSATLSKNSPNISYLNTPPKNSTCSFFASFPYLPNPLCSSGAPVFAHVRTRTSVGSARFAT